MILPLVLYPDKRLLEPTRPVPEFDQILVDLVESMRETMTHENGVGLAANQVGSPYSVFVFQNTFGAILTVINPSVLSFDSRHPQRVYQEGCLSVPGVARWISRPASIQLQYYDVQGARHERWFHSGPGNIDATIVQHELDHLFGFLMTTHPEAPPQPVGRL